MADIYARDFMLKLGYNLKDKVPLLDFKTKLLNVRAKV